MAVPLTVKQYKIKEHLSAYLDAMTVPEVLAQINVPVPEEDSAEYASWSDAVNRVRNRLLS